MCVCVCIHGHTSCACSVVPDSSETSGAVACQVPLSIGFPRQEYWSRLLFHSPGDLPNPGTEPMFPESLALSGRFFTIESPRKPTLVKQNFCYF